MKDPTEVRFLGGVLYLCDGIGVTRVVGVCPRGRGQGALWAQVFEGAGERFPRIAEGRRMQGLLCALCPSTGRLWRKRLRQAVRAAEPYLEVRRAEGNRWYSEQDVLAVARHLPAPCALGVRAKFAATRRLYDALRREHPVDPQGEQSLLERFTTEHARWMEVLRLATRVGMLEWGTIERAREAAGKEGEAAIAKLPTPFGEQLDERRAFPYLHATLSAQVREATERSRGLRLVQGGMA